MLAPCVCCRQRPASDPEVGQAGVAAGIEEDVGWLDIAVDDACFVGVVERPSDPLQDSYGALLSDGTAPEQVP